MRLPVRAQRRGGCRRGRSGPGAGGRRCARSHRAFEDGQQVADVDDVAHLDLELFEHAGGGRRDFHRGLVGLHRDQRLLDLDGVAGLDQDFNDGDILEVADVGDADFDRAGGGGSRSGCRHGAATDLLAAGAGAAWAAAGFDAEGAASAPATSSVRTTEPCLTLSSSLTLSSLTTPAWLEGISMEALSDSTVISDCSAFTVSPGLTSNSITVTSSKSPISGT
jgi:hypothetical protein